MTSDDLVDRTVEGLRRAETDAHPVPAAARIATDRPTPARIYDFMLGGKDNFAVDREAAMRIAGTTGLDEGRRRVWENRIFLQRAVRHLARAGIDQFLDLGAGLPTAGNVHEVAHEVNPDARVVYVDNDPIVLAHGRALLADDRTTTVVTADLRDPAAVLAHPEVAGRLDLDRPVGLLLVSVLHFVGDEEDPGALVAGYRDALVPGSHLAMSHFSPDGWPQEWVDAMNAGYRGATERMRMRSRERIARFLDGWRLLEPGLVRPLDWRPEGEPAVEPAQLPSFWAGVGALG